MYHKCLILHRTVGSLWTLLVRYPSCKAIVRITALALTVGMSCIAHAEPAPIKIGVIEDQSGDFAAAGTPKLHGVELAAKEINAQGGILGRQLVIISYDPQSDNRRYQEFARKAIQQDKVDVLFAGFTSASREAIRPIVDRNGQLYFYANEYEGGLCDSNTFVTGGVPEQLLTPLVSWLSKNVGKRFYTVAADYNFGQISGEWIRNLVASNGGTLVGEEYIPLSVSQFSSTIAKIQAAKPDVVMSLMIGANQTAFFEQAAAAGLKTPLASFVNGPVFYEHKKFKSPTFDGVYIAANYLEELQTTENKQFVERWRQKFPKEPYINQVGEDAYLGVKIYAEAVKNASSSDQAAVIKALEAGNVCVNAPEGKVCVDPKTHHTTHTVTLAQVLPDHSLKMIEIYPDQRPYWLSDAGCDLPKKRDNKQYTPSDPPAK
jgi:urea transport system substrate-binding protein